MNKISVVVPFYNGKSGSNKMLAVSSYLHSQDYPTDKFEVIIVENPFKTDIVHGICNKYGFKHVSSDLGSNKARNAGIREATGDIIALCDDDVIVNSNWLGCINTIFSSANNIAVCGGRVLPVIHTDKPKWITAEFMKMLSIVDYGNQILSWDDGLKTRHIVSANCAFKKSVWNAVGGFPDDIGLSGNNMGCNDEVEFFIKCAEEKGLIYYNGLMEAGHLIDNERLCLNWFRKRFYSQGIADAQLEFRSNSTRDTCDFYHDALHYVPDRINLYNHEINKKTRDEIADEPSMRQYIKNIIICKTDYIAGFQNEILGESHWCQIFR